MSKRPHKLIIRNLAKALESGQRMIVEKYSRHIYSDNDRVMILAGYVAAKLSKQGIHVVKGE